MTDSVIGPYSEDGRAPAVYVPPDSYAIAFDHIYYSSAGRWYSMRPQECPRELIVIAGAQDVRRAVEGRALELPSPAQQASAEMARVIEGK